MCDDLSLLPDESSCTTARNEVHGMGCRRDRRIGRTVRLLICGLGISALGALSAAPALAAAAATRAAAATAIGPVAHATQVGTAPPAQTVQLVLPLTADVAGLERLAVAVSTKGSPQYGQYESVAELARRFGASQQARTRVVTYLRSEGATGVKVDATGLFADARMTVDTAQRLFGTQLGQFQVRHSPRFIAPTSPPSVPAAISGQVTGVIGLDTQQLAAAAAPRLGTSLRQSRATLARATSPVSGYEPRTGTASGCIGALGTGAFTPNQYLGAYDYGPLRGAGVAGRGEKVALIEIDGFRYSDIRTFAGCFDLPIPAINGFGVGVSKPLAPGAESTLDIEVLDATAPGLKAINVYESKPQAADLLQALTAPLQTRRDQPQVISASLGVCERDLFAAVGAAGVDTAQGSLALAAASGISFLASSGDSGSSACPAVSEPVDALAVSFPASSWLVTGVGGTNIALNASNQILAQPVWNDGPVQLGAGGGGTSGLFGRPAYQKAVNRTGGRSVPDVSMLADVAPGYAIFCSSKPECINHENSNPWMPVGGTSAATPLFAAGLALVDQDLRVHGRQGLGLVNPLLYSLGTSSLASAVFDDVTLGDNDLGPFLASSGGEPLGCCTAAVGYDQASGWGSVDLSHFAQIATEVVPKLAGIRLSLARRQRPVSRRQLLATVSCTRSCLTGSLAQVAIGRARPFVLESNIYRLPSAGRKTVALTFSGGQRSRLRAGLKAHRRIVATVYGLIVDAGDNIEKRTGPQRLTITG
jgi:kumamolisin